MTAKQLAEHIILAVSEEISRNDTYDMVWSTIEEDDGSVGMNQDEFDTLVDRVHSLVQEAEVRVTFRG